ncbi:hypothetical protein D3C85_1085230 [compost metagenome]
MHAQYFIRAFVRQDLHEAFGLVVDLGPAVGGEGELADPVGAALGLQLLLALAHGGDFRAGVDHVGDDVVIHLGGLAGNALDADDGLVLGLVRQHRAGGDVAYHPDPRRAALVAVVGEHAAWIGGQANGLQAQALGVGAATDGHQYVVGPEGFRQAAGGGFDGELHGVLIDLGAGDLGTQLEAHALLGQGALQGFAGFVVQARTDAAQVFHHRHLGAQAAPDRAQLQADHPGADHHQVLGHFRQGQGAG